MSYHITDKGEVKICQAKSPDACKFISIHFDNMEDAQSYADDINRWEVETDKAMNLIKDKKLKEYKERYPYKEIAEFSKSDFNSMTIKEIENAKEYISNFQKEMRDFQNYFLDKHNESRGNKVLSRIFYSLHSFANKDWNSMNKIDRDLDKILEEKIKETRISKDGFKVINADEEISLNKKYTKIFKKHDKEEQYSLLRYTQTTYEFINGYLRGKDVLNDPELAKRGMAVMNQDFINQEIENLDKFTDYELKEDTKFFRGINKKFYKELEVGNNLEYTSYMSTSIDFDVAKFHGDYDKEDKVLFEINAPKGTKGFYIGDNSLTPRDKEFLFPKNTKMVVKSIRKDIKDDFDIVVLEIL